MEKQIVSREQDLPSELDGYKLRTMQLDDIVVLEYSKRQLFFRHIHPSSFSAKLIDDNLLFDVVAPNLEEAVTKMKEKVRKYREK